MRIIAGEFRGRRLAAVRGRVRPTSDRVREAIFNILGGEVAGARVLDLFAGTGALALEALSRGAAMAVLVEEAPAAVAVIRQNVAHLGVQERVRLLPLPVAGAIKKLARAGAHFEVVFLDPPYGQGLAAATLTQLGEGKVLGAGAIVVAEMSRRETPPPAAGRLTLREVRDYGDTRVAFYACATAHEKEP